MTPTATGNTHTFETRSADQTIEIGRQIAALLHPPKLLVLQGDLGAGKTTLVKGIAEAYGAAEAHEVTSPTFTLLHEYEGTQDGARVLLCHLDLYRVEDERQLASIGLDEMPERDSIVLVEWGEKFPNLARRRDGDIVVTSSGGDARQIRLTLR